MDGVFEEAECGGSWFMAEGEFLLRVESLEWSQSEFLSKGPTVQRKGCPGVLFSTTQQILAINSHKTSQGTQ